MQKLISKKLVIIAIAAIIGLFAYGNFNPPPPPPTTTQFEYVVLYESLKWVYADFNNTKKREFYIWFKSGEDSPAQKKVSETIKTAKHISDALNTLGSFGWELVDSHYEEGETWSSHEYYFKKPKN
jgi:hypothetical protein